MKKLSYKKAGVNVAKANSFIKKITPLVKKTKRSGWVSNIGAFAGFFRPDLRKFKDPLIVSSTDGVGTKLILAKNSNIYDTVGIDLVAMCVNDLITCGAEPLFFLDYFATGKLSTKVSYDVIKGIVKGCKISNCALVGGETAELPGLYKKGDYDLAGFSVGIVDRKKIIDGSKIDKGDFILGIASSGIHSNGYSLVRKAFERKKISKGLLKILLIPTAIYVRPILDLIKKFKVNGIAHITGGGFEDNIVRLLPEGKSAVIYRGSWPVHSIFNTIQEMGNIEDDEMYRTFNMGIGMTLVVPRKDIFNVNEYLLKKHKLKNWIIGEIIDGKKRVEVI